MNIRSLFLLLLLFAATSCHHSSHPDNEAHGADSIYDYWHIYNIAFAQPNEALALLDTSEQRRLLNPFQLNLLRCLTYHNGLSQYRLALNYALKAYGDPDARKDPEQFLRLIEVIVDQYYENGNYAESVRYAGEGIRMAREAKLEPCEANLLLYIGLNRHKMGQLDESYRYFDQAIELLKKDAAGNNQYELWDDLVYAYGMKINTQYEDGRYREALTMRSAYREAMQRLEDFTDTPDGMVDMRFASEYAAYACICHYNGDTREAEDCYRRLLETRYAATPDGEALRIPYLLLAGHYQEALHLIKREKQYWQESMDTISFDYIDNHLAYELKAFEGLADYRSVARIQQVMLALTDTLRLRERREDALELAEIYKTNEQTILLKEQASSITVRNIVIISAIILLLTAGIFILRILLYNRTIRHKNTAMVQTIKDLLSYKDELFHKQEENIILRQELCDARRLHMQTQIKNETQDTSSGNASADTDKILYDRMNREIITRRLFLQPEFSKKELIKIVYIPTNKFAQLFKQFAGTDFQSYIQRLQLEYAAQLLKENPAWTIEAVAKGCNLSKATLYRRFMERYGVTPTKFRENILCPDAKEKNNEISEN